MKAQYSSPTIQPVGGGDVQPMAVLTAFFYVVAAFVWTGAAVWNYLAAVNAAYYANVTHKSML